MADAAVRATHFALRDGTEPQLSLDNGRVSMCSCSCAASPGLDGWSLVRDTVQMIDKHHPRTDPWQARCIADRSGSSKEV